MMRTILTPRRRLGTTASLVTLALLVTAGSAYSQGPDAIDDLRRDIDTIIDQPDLNDGELSVMVIEADSGNVLYEHNPDGRLMPASNMKLYSSAAAMELLGPDYRFTTEVKASGRQRGGVLRGDLHLVGGGDPTMLAEDYADLAAQVADAGVTTVTGDLVADDTRWDDERLGRSWSHDSEQYYYGAQISALTVSPDTDYDAGTVLVGVQPGDKVGDPAKFTVTPETSYVEIDNQVKTVASGGGVSFSRPHGTNTIRITGEISIDSSGTRAWRSVWEPSGLAADVFARALADNGVTVRGGTRFEGTPSRARTVASHDSMTVGDLLIPFMKLSNNGHAEALIKEIGYDEAGDGSWGAGLDAADQFAKSVGVEVDRTRIVDGSGLSRMNVISSRQILNLLAAVPNEPWFDTWYQSLPVAGVEERFVGGTLRFRMAGTAAAGNLRGKTGTLTGATALSGYVTDADGELLLFSIITNNHIAVDPKPAVEDPIGIRLAEFSRTGDSAVSPTGVSDPAAGTGATTGDGEVPELECTWTRTC